MRTHTDILELLLWVWCLLQTSQGRPPAEPLAEKNCQHLKLDLRPQTGHVPVYVLTSKTTYGQNTRITVTLQAKEGEWFTGFRLVARSSEYQLEEEVSSGYGAFYEHSGKSRVSCGKLKDRSVLIQSDIHIPKTSVTATWIAPSEFGKSPPGDLKFWAAISQRNETYWVPFESNKITYKKGVCATTDENNCFRYPEACADDECYLLVGWQMDGDYMSFGVSGLVTGNQRYLAVGFSTTGAMFPAATVNCVRSERTSDVEITSATNQGHNNRPLSPPSLGLHPTMSGQYVDGRITCQFSYIKSKRLVRSLAHHQSDWDLLADLTDNKYYLIAAMGEVDSDGNLQYHGMANIASSKLMDFLASTRRPTSRSSLSYVGPLNENENPNEGNQIDQNNKINKMTANDVCTPGKHCYRSPENCAVKDCDFIIGWLAEGDYVNFGISANLLKTNNYLAIGFSTNGDMSPSPTVDCIHGVSEIEIKSAKNVGSTNSFHSPPTLGLDTGSLRGEYVDGRLVCHFGYVRSPSITTGENQIQDLLADLTGKEYYLLMAEGNVDQQGNLEYHSARIASSASLNFTASLEVSTSSPETTTSSKLSTELPVDPASPINTKDCGLTKSCFRDPPLCGASVCEYVVTWTSRENYVDFEVEMPVTQQRYVAVGFSAASRKMAPAAVVVCRFNSDSTFSVLSTENVDTPFKKNRILKPPTLGLEPNKNAAGYVEGRIVCRFSYVKSPSRLFSQNADDAADAIADFENMTYHLIMAKGPLGSFTSGIGYHTDKESSTSAINFAMEGFVNIGGVTQNQLIKVHGSLMTIAWMLCAGLGLLLPRYFKPVWPTTKLFNKHIWFVLHVSLMVTVSVLTVAGFVVIFIQVEGFSAMKGLPQASHPIVGIIVTCLAVINPMLGLMRCHPDSPHRWVFNWGHRLVGQGAFTGAAANLLTAMYMSQAGVADSTKWVVVAYIVWHVLAELVLLGLQHKSSCGPLTSSESYDMSGEDNPIHSHGTIEVATLENSEKQAEVLWPQTVVLVIYAIGVVSFSLRLVLIIAADI